MRQKFPSPCSAIPYWNHWTTSAAQAGRAACQCPAYAAKCHAFEHLRYSGRDAAGATFVRIVDGFHARVVQHEVDHLDGVLYPRRVEDMTRFGFTDILFPELAA